MIKLSVALPGAEKVAVALGRWGQGLDDWTPFWTSYFIPIWFALMVEQYESQGAATGAAWAPLTDAYAAWKLKHYPGQPVGVLTGSTRSSLTSPSDANAVVSAMAKSFAVGTKSDYPIFLQMGTRRRGAASGRRPLKNYKHGATGAGMVARPPMNVNKDFMTKVGKTMQRFAVDAAKKAQLPLPLSGSSGGL